MTKATISLPDGTRVEIDGTPEEVARLLSIYGGGEVPEEGSPQKKTSKKKKKVHSSTSAKAQEAPEAGEQDGVDLIKIIEVIRNCDEAEKIETEVLDKPGQVNRILLPLFIVHEHLDNSFALTSGEISKVTTDLGVPVQTPNASRTLSGTASRYVIGDSVRKKGQPVRYKLSRRGVQYFKEVLGGNNDE